MIVDIGFGGALICYLFEPTHDCGATRTRVVGSRCLAKIWWRMATFALCSVFDHGLELER